MERTNELEQRVLHVLRHALALPLEADTDVIEGGLLDSLSFVDLLVRLEEEFSIRIRVTDLEIDDFRDARAIARYIGRSHDLS